MPFMHNHEVMHLLGKAGLHDDGFVITMISTISHEIRYWSVADECWMQRKHATVFENFKDASNVISADEWFNKCPSCKITSVDKGEGMVI